MKSTISNTTQPLVKADIFEVGTLYALYRLDKVEFVVYCTYIGPDWPEPKKGAELDANLGGGICVYERPGYSEENHGVSFLGLKFHMGGRRNVKVYDGSVTISN